MGCDFSLLLMAIQKDAGLRQPVNHEAPPTLVATPLTPDVAYAVLNLYADSLSQLATGINLHLFRSPLTMVLAAVFTLALAYGMGLVTDLIEDVRTIEGSILLRPQLVTILCLFVSALAASFLAVSYGTLQLKDDMATAKTTHQQPLGVDLTHFARLEMEPSNKQMAAALAKGENLRVMTYRDTPIAFAAVRPVTGALEFTVRVGGLGVRKVYVKSGLHEDLLAWAVQRAKELYAVNNQPGKTITVLVDVYSPDKVLLDALKALEFKPVEGSKVYTNRMLRAYGVSRETWGVKVVTAFEGESNQAGYERIVKREEKKARKRK